MGEVIELLKGVSLGDVGFPGLVTLFIVLIFKGLVVPRSTLELLQASTSAIIAAKNEENQMLKDAYVMSEEARKVESSTDREVLELSRTAVHLLQSIHERAHGAEVENDLAH